MGGIKHRRRKDRFALLPREVVESTAYRWLPHFARSVLVAFAAQYSGANNGGISMTSSDAKRLGVYRDELSVGIELLLRAKLLVRIRRHAGRSGKGVPAKYALTFQPLNDFDYLERTDDASNDWADFVEPFPRPTTLFAAEVALGRRASRRRPTAGENSIEVAGPVRPKTGFKCRTSPAETHLSSGPVRQHKIRTSPATQN